MRMTDKQAVDLVMHIANDPELKKSYDYLAHYVFKGLYNYQGKSLFQVVEDTGGWQEFCTQEIFWAIDFVEPPTGELMDRLAGYAVQYLAYLVAVDMFVDKFRLTTIYKDADKEIRLFSGEHSVTNSRIDLYFIAGYKVGTSIQQKNFHMYISPDSGSFTPEKNVLDQKLTIDTPSAKATSSYNRKTVRLKDLSKATLVEILKEAGWLDLKI